MSLENVEYYMKATPNKNIYSNILRSLVFLLLATSVYAQKDPNQLFDYKKVSIDVNSAEDDEFNVIPFEQNGLVVLNLKTNGFGRDLRLVFLKYDTDLNFEWQNTFAPGGIYKLIKYYETDDYLFCLLKEEDERKTLILRLDINTGDFVVTECDMLTRMDINIFVMVKSKALIGGNYNERPVIELINLFDQSAKVLPEVHANHIEINNIEVNPQNGNIYVLLKNTKNCKLFLKVYSYNGKVLSSSILGEKKRLPVNGKILTTPDGEYVLAGNYADNCSDYSVGFYTHPLTQEGKTKFYNFTELSNFLSYLPEKRQKRIQRRLKAKKLRGKDVKMRHRLLLHDPKRTSQGITMVAEVFYPEYKSSYNMLGLPVRNYRWLSNNYENFNSFKYTHALICTFDNDGELIWDNSIGLQDVEGRTLSEKIQLSEAQGKLLLAYPDEGIIKTSILRQGEKVESQIEIDLSELPQDFKVLDDVDSELASWYDHVFIAYGIQNIRKPGEVILKDIFYLTKLTYQ